MPTANPRVYVTLPPELDSIIARMAALERISKSQLIRETLEAAQPTLAKAVAIMEAASKARIGARSELAKSLEHSQNVVESELENILRAVSEAPSGAVDVVERRPRRGAKAHAAGAVSGSLNPPPSKRGVKSSKRPKTEPSVGATKGGSDAL